MWNRIDKLTCVLSMGIIAAGAFGCRERSTPPVEETRQQAQDKDKSPAPADDDAPPIAVPPERSDSDAPPPEISILPGARLIVATDPEVEEAFADIIARWQSINSLSAEIQSSLDQKKDPRQLRRGTGVYKCLKKNSDLMIYARIMFTLMVDRGEKDWALTRQRLTYLKEGPYVTVLDEWYESASAYKYRTTDFDIPRVGGPELIRNIRGFGRVERRPDETVEGKNVYVLHAATEGVQSATFRIDKSTGLLAGFDAKYEETGLEMSASFSNVQVNVELSDEELRFELPEGVELLDRTVAAENR